MRAFVTGAAGFIASYLIPRLVEMGAEVVAFDIVGQPDNLKTLQGEIRYVRGDLGSPSDLYRAMTIHQPTDVFHLGSILAGPCDDNPIRAFSVNFGSTMTLLDAALAVSVRRFLMISSISVFGKGVPEPVCDDAAKNPANIYGQTKLAGEHLLLWYAAQHGLDTRALRFSWVFGPGRTTGITALYSSLLLDAIATRRPLDIPNPEEKGDWLYVKDAVKAILALWKNEIPGQRIYNVAGGVHSIREVIEIARRIRPDARVHYSETGASLSPYPTAYNDSVFRSEVGFAPDYSIEAAVREHIEIVGNQE